MRVLLDTHAFLWFVGGSTQLSTKAQAIIAESATEPLLSVASVWEMAVKVSLGKLTLAAPFHAFVATQMKLNGMTLLGITVDHAARVSGPTISSSGSL
jgi:PIN domain nuclease of toxin-antitoxin system